jgi:tetratricopeptide (TPR) repeat protein
MLGNMTTDGKSRDPRAELDQVRDLLQEDARNPALLRQCARLAIELRQYPEALDFATRAESAGTGDPEARFHHASALVGLRRYAEAVGVLSELRGQAGMQPGVDTNLALCYYVLGDYTRARPVLDALIAGASPTADVVRLAVSTLHHLGDLSAAISVADSHAAAGVSDAAVAGVFSLAYLDASRTAEAARYAAHALAKNPASIDALTVQATLKLAKLDTDAAAGQFRSVLELAPENGRAWVGLGAIALLSPDLPEALKCLERGVAAMPAHVGSWQVLGWTYLVSGNLDAAERTFQRALEMDPNFAEAHGSMASIHALRGRTARAQREIDIADRLDRDGLAARFASAVLLGRAGDPEAGRSLIRATATSLAPRLGGRAARVLMGAMGSPTRH